MVRLFQSSVTSDSTKYTMVLSYICPTEQQWAKLVGVDATLSWLYHVYRYNIVSISFAHSLHWGVRRRKPKRAMRWRYQCNNFAYVSVTKDVWSCLANFYNLLWITVVQWTWFWFQCYVFLNNVTWVPEQATGTYTQVTHNEGFQFYVKTTLLCHIDAIMMLLSHFTSTGVVWWVGTDKRNAGQLRASCRWRNTSAVRAAD